MDVGGLGVRADASVDHLGVELLGIVLRFQAQGIFLHALRAEVVAQAADANHQRVVANLLDRCDRQSVAVHVRGQVNRLGFAVEPFQLADAECEVIPVRLRHVTDLMVAKVHAARGNFMQLGLPDVGPVFVHQGDVGLCAAPEGFAKAGSELQAAGSPADDDDFVCIFLHHGFTWVCAQSYPCKVHPRAIVGHGRPAEAIQTAHAHPQGLRPGLTRAGSTSKSATAVYAAFATPSASAAGSSLVATMKSAAV